jgi:hypothetical protein
MFHNENRIAGLLTQIRERVIPALRVTVAALLPLWAVLTSLIVTQMSLGFAR